MKMIELTKDKFEEFVKNNKYSNYCQTQNYADAMKYNNYECLYVGYTTNDLEILAAGMFLLKKLNKKDSYAYSPKGFIINYEDAELVRKFTRNIIKFFKRKKIIFLKINPELPIATIDYNKNFEKKPTNNIQILEDLKKIGFMKRKEKVPFDLLEPKITALINLKEYNINKLNNDFSRKINESETKGYDIVYGDSKEIEELNKFINPNLLDYYKNLYESFKKNESADLIFLKINYEKFLISAKKRVEQEQEKNDLLNEKLQKDTSDVTLKEKMISDKLLEEYKQEVIHATAGLKKKENTYLAAGLIIKYDKKISLVIAANNKDFEKIEPHYYFYNKILEMYKDNYEIADLYGIANDFTQTSKYEQYNKFKFGFNPIVYEYIGELDIIINKLKYNIYKNIISYSKIVNKK